MGNIYFDQLLELAAGIVHRANAENTTDKNARKTTNDERHKLEVAFSEIKKKYVSELLDNPKTRDQAYDLVSSYMSVTRATCDPSWLPGLDYMSDRLLPYLEKQAKRDPRVRKLRQALPLVVIAIGVSAYFAIRFVSTVHIEHEIETREGIKERASALEKVLRYDDWMDTRVRKGGWMKGILLWPIKPTESEIGAAAEFAGLAYEAHELSVEYYGCSAIRSSHGDSLSKAEIEYLSKISAYFRRSDIHWLAPPVVTVIEASRVANEC